MYTLTGKNSFIRNSDGATIPFTIKNSDYVIAVNYLKTISPSVISVDSDYVIGSLTPDGVHLFAVPVADVATLKVRAKAEIDDAAGRARGRYITVAPGQDATYMAKAMDADKFEAAGYSPSDGTGFLWVQAEKEAMGGSTTAEQAANSIIAQRDLWYMLGSGIEQVRIGGKLDIDTKLNDADITSSKNATVAALNSI